MPKLKTHKSASKRIVGHKGRRFIVRTMSAQHRTMGKSARTLQKAGEHMVLSKANQHRFEKLLPNY